MKCSIQVPLHSLSLISQPVLLTGSMKHEYGLMEALEVFDAVQQKYNLPFKLKHEQRLVLNILLKGGNVLAVLPTGFGKSLIFGALPLMLNEVRLSATFINRCATLAR